MKAVVFLLVGSLISCSSSETETIKVGVLHSMTGTMAISEKSVMDATLMAIDEINQNGGLLGRQIEAIVVDGRSDWKYFAQQAQRLIVEEEVSVIFGCWTSACRKTVKPIFEKYDHLFFYPVQYEGMEQSPNIIYTGATPNQQILPAVNWSFNHLGKRFFLAASDYVFPHAANEIIKDQVSALGGEIVGEYYILLGSSNVEQMLKAIAVSQPDAILNTINGSSNIAFFEGLKTLGITSNKIPVVSFSIAEDELRSMDLKLLVGNYAAWNYFQSINSPTNLQFVNRFTQKYGNKRVTDDPIEAGYFGVYLWAEAVKRVSTVETTSVRQVLKGQSFIAPGGLVTIDSKNNHTWKKAYIGKIGNDGQFQIVWRSNQAIRPMPFPLYRPRVEWEEFLDDLYQGWGQNWAAQDSDDETQALKQK